MLPYVLALVVGLGSLGIYLAAFFVPEIHRKSDFYWSGIGLFYALMLWVCAGRITGGVLLGQIAGVALLGWFGWQTLALRRQLTSPVLQTELPSQAEATQKITGFFSGIKGKLGKASQTKAQSSVKPGVLPKEALEQPKAEDFAVAETARTTEALPPDATEDETVIFTEKSKSPFEAIATPTDSLSTQPPSPELVSDVVEDAESKNIPSSTSPATEPENPV
jgi:Ycf66 protein N-terminus